MRALRLSLAAGQHHQPLTVGRVFSFRGVNQQHAAAWNGSGEFWATVEHRRAEWFALSNPASPPAACFEFHLAEPVLLAILQMAPVAAVHHAPHDYEFLPASYPLLNHGMQNKQITAIP